MKRRELLIAMAASLLATSRLGRAQQRTYTVAWLSGATETQVAPLRQIVAAQLAAAGFVEGRNLRIVVRYAAGRLERLPGLAKELAAVHPDVFVASGTQAAIAVRDATSETPIVFAFVSDPVASGLVTDLSRPGGRITGYTNMNFDLVAKRLAILREAFPAADKVAVLHNPKNAPEVQLMQHVRGAATALKVDLSVVEVSSEADFERAFHGLERRRPDALFVLENATNVTNRQRILDFAARQRIPAMYGFEGFVEAGGLMAFCARQKDQALGAADYAARILRGDSVKDLPIRLPDRFALIINIRTAKSLGITLPASLLMRADEVIE